MASYIYGPSFLSSIWDGSFKQDSVYEFLKNKLTGKFDNPSKNEEDLTFQVLCSLFTRDKRFPFWSLDNLDYLSNEGKKLYSYEIEEKYLRTAAQEIVKKPNSIYTTLFIGMVEQ